MEIRPEDFYSHAPPRVTGTEWESDIQLRGTGSYRNWSELLAASTFERIGMACAGVNDRDDDYAPDNYLGNGSRLYVDYGSVVEYSSGEALGPRRACAADFAGITVMERLLESSGLPLRGLYRRVGSGFDTETLGYHCNFLIPTSLINDRMVAAERLEVLFADLATRVWAWNGTVGPQGYEMSQKARGIGQTRSWQPRDRVNKHGMKPMVMVRQSGAHGLRGADRLYDYDDVNPLAEWARLEVRFADSPISRGIGYLGLAGVTLDLRLLEHWDIAAPHLADVPLADAVGAMREATLDPDMQATFETRSGKTVTAANIQEMLSDARRAVAARVELPDDEAAAIAPIAGMADDMAAITAGDDLSRMQDYAANADKFVVLRHVLGGATPTSDDTRTVQIDIEYDRVFKPGIGMKRRQKYPAMRQFDEALVPASLVDELVERGDPATRAGRRGDYVTEHGAEISRINWSGARSGVQRVEWPDPYGVVEREVPLRRPA